MTKFPLRLLVSWCITIGLCVAIGCSRTPFPDEKAEADDSAVSGVFVGSSPCGESIRSLLQIAPGVDAHMIQWKLTLRQDPQTRAPAGYELHCKYGRTVPGQPGLDRSAKAVERQGRWTIAKGTKSNPDAVAYELDGAVSLYKVDANLLHVLNRDRSLMIGTGGWSYTLNRVEASEKRASPSPATAGPSRSYTISPVATGPSVFGVFEGRSPCQGIARDLKIVPDADGTKVKWRVTLYQNPETRAPTTYKVESSLHRQSAREGNWSILRGTEADPHAVVYRLEPARAEAGLFLLKGDDNVLFFLNQDRRPLVGHADFSYTLNRRNTAPAAGSVPPD